MNHVELCDIFHSQISTIQHQTLIDLKQIADRVGVTDYTTIIRAVWKLEEMHPKEVLYLSTLGGCLIVVNNDFSRCSQL
jgi:hypothetical protein